MEKILKVILGIITGIIGLALGAIITGIFVMLLWNWLMPVIFGLTTISFWQAVGISFLCGALFKNSSSN